MNTLIMGSYTDVKNLIISNIKANGQREITGPILQDVLLNMLENSSRVEEITYSDLKALRDGAKLTPSRLYRITDYITTTVQSNTKSARHPFDVIVLAISESELLEQAWAIQHEGDEYFANSNLSDWEIWYCLDNDTTQFAWADSTNGKGVIYRMIDEWNNDCPYDFKNIQFYRKWDSSKSSWSTISSDNTGVPCYTFSSNGNESTTLFRDMSLYAHNNIYSNVIKKFIQFDKQTLNNNCFFGNLCYSNTLRNDCYSNTFGNSCYDNTFGNNCYSNTFGNVYYHNTFGGYCYFNTFGNDCYHNIFGNSCRNNDFGNDCSSNIFGNSCNSNTFSKVCGNNNLGDYCDYNRFGNGCWDNNLGDYCNYNRFGASCYKLKFTSDSSVSAKYQFYRYNYFGDGCQYIVFTGAETASSSAQVQNYKFAQGLQGTSDEYLTIDGKRNRSYETYISRDTDGTIKESVIADKLDKIIETTYANLVSLRDSSNLIPGQQYRITDYQCTTSQTNTRSAGHQFDIIVTADSESILNEKARAIKHEDDTYFAECDLNAWQIWYCLDNDTTRFAWADSTNGKGVIYRMIDEFNNDVPYDFKNIQFYRKWSETKSLWSTISSDNTGVPCYTFSSEGSSSTTSFTDMSLNVPNNDYSNVIKEYISSNKQTLNNNCFFGINCGSNTFENNCYNNSFDSYCSYNSFGNDCQFNSFGNFCYANSLGDYCTSNTFGYGCSSNTIGDGCFVNTFGPYCSYNSFGNDCEANSFGSFYKYNSFGNGCYCNSFRVSSSTTSSLKNYVYYNHLDDGCSYNVIWNSKTTSSSTLLKNVNVNRGVVGTSSSYNMINIDVLNSEQEININQIDGVVSISNISDILKKLDKIIELSYSELVTLRDDAQLIPGQQYRIIDYITTTTQENTKSAWHQFDIIVTALDESTLSEEAQAIQNSNDGYFDDSNLSAWKIWYCLDNDTNRFVWAGDNVPVDEIERKKYDSSKCTIKSELINGNAFITPFNFESCVWVDGNNDGLAYSDDHIHHDISELIYEWGYFTDENEDPQLCIYKSDADLYAEEGHPDYGDKYLYRGVVNVDGAEYDYWQKWDVDGDYGLNVGGGDDYVYATTQRIVSNPEAYSATIETEDVYGQGKGVIYRMIDEWNNDVPYDFKNIQYNGSWGYWAYTFNWINDDSDNTCEDMSVAQYAHTNDEGGYSHTYGNIIKPCETAYAGDYGFPLRLNTCVFLNTESFDSGMCYGFYSNIFGNNCYDNTFGNDCKNNIFGDRCSSNTVGYDYSGNTFGYYCSGNTFGNNCHDNTLGNKCSDNLFGERCSVNTLDLNCYNNTFGNEFSYNTLGSDCMENTFGDDCCYNTFGNNCKYIKFASDKNATAKYNFYQNNHFGEGCKYIIFKGIETASYRAQIQNYNFSQGLQGTSSAYLTIDGVRDLSYEAKVAKNSKGEIKIYCEADLIA